MPSGCRQNILSYYMTTAFLVRENHSYSHSSSLNANRKKIKHYSYSLNDKIGKGFSSIVYKGTNENTNEIVAIKAIDMKGVKDAVSREMLDCEIEALTKLKHPNILKCYDVIRETSHCYIVTEFCNEGDLSSILKKKRRMTETEVLKIMKDIVSGFVQIGENKFLHRDLKLANIFMNNGVAKIADFGFAKKSHSSFQREKYNVGSPLYMSPQALKKNIYSIKNDIWSIGIMIYEMLHGETPWECRTESELMDKMTRVPVKFRQTLSISQDMRDFIKKCLEVDESRRMALAELKPWCHGSQNTYPLQELELGARRTSLNENQNVMRPLGEVKPLGDATNRHSLGVEKTRSLSNVVPKLGNDFKSNLNTYKDKENNRSAVEQKRSKLNKLVIDKNNTILLIEINKFRLFFKIYEKVKHTASEEKLLLTVLGADILRRVESVAQIILNGGSEKSKQRAEELGLKQLQSYLKEETNSSIKKYVSVIKQYQRKYKSEIDSTPSTSTNANELLKKFVSNGRINKELSKDELLMCYWIIEAVTMRIDVKKEELDKIIDGKSIPSRESMVERVKEFL